ncbi:MAG: L-histidine N(alpha)-methyltransferase, partial [Nannocystaceae bacterium]
NRDLAADFDVEGFRHRAVWNAAASRIEMHIVSRRPQRVRFGDAALEFGEGEAIVSEHCYKYTVDGFAAMGRRVGLEREALWLDAEGRYSLHLFRQVR